MREVEHANSKLTETRFSLEQRGYFSKSFPLATAVVNAARKRDVVDPFRYIKIDLQRRLIPVAE